MRSIAFADFLIGVGILFVIEGLMFAASPAWMRRAMKSALATPDNHPARGRHRLGGDRADPDLGGSPPDLTVSFRVATKNATGRPLKISGVKRTRS